MKLSVIIPVYNVEPYLAKCLDSVIAQSEWDWECICVDDGSTDGSAKVLAEFAVRDSRIKIITQKNAGVSAARNAGLAVAQGEWVHFVDSDDYLVSDFYQRVFARVAETPHAEVVVTAMKSLYVDGSSRIPNVGMGVGVIEGDVLGQIFRTSRMGIAYCMADKVCRRRLLTGNGIRFMKGLHSGEDSLCCQSVLATAGCVVLDANNNGYCYWHHPSSLTQSLTVEKYKYKINVVAEELAIWHRTHKQGALLFAHQAALDCLFAVLDYPAKQQAEYCAFLLNSRAFKRDILPTMMMSGAIYGRIVGLVLFALPRPLCLVIVKLMRRCRHV